MMVIRSRFLFPLIACLGACVPARGGSETLRLLEDRRGLDYSAASWCQKYLRPPALPPAAARFVMEPGSDPDRCDTPRVRYEGLGAEITVSQTAHLFAVQVSSPGRKVGWTLGELQTLARKVFADSSELRLTGGKPIECPKSGRATIGPRALAIWLGSLRWSQAGGSVIFYFLKQEQRGQVGAARRSPSFSKNRYWFSPHSPGALPEGPEQWVIRSLTGLPKPDRAAEARADQSVTRWLAPGFRPAAPLRWLPAVEPGEAVRPLVKRYAVPRGVLELTVAENEITVSAEAPVPEAAPSAPAEKPEAEAKLPDPKEVAALAAELFQDAQGVQVKVTGASSGGREGALVTPPGAPAPWLNRVQWRQTPLGITFRAPGNPSE